MKLKPLFFTLFLVISTLSSAAETDNANDTEANSADSSTTEATTASRVMPDPARQQQADLAQAQNAETDVVWLELNDQKQLALLQRATTATPTGHVIMFTAPSTGADWPDLVHPLRTQLTEYGWNTLSLSLPRPPAAAIPKRTLPNLQNSNQLQSPSDNETADADQTSTETADAASVTPDAAETPSANDPMVEYTQQIVTLGDLAASRLAELPGDITIILGIGEGAVWAMHYFSQDETQENRFLVLLDPMPVTDDKAPSLLTMIKNSQSPILDLWFNDNRYQQQQAKLRMHTALRSGNEGYQQFRLNQRANASKKEPLWLTRQLRGILKNHLQTSQPPDTTTANQAELTPGS
ncbi:DUF3530 family protein [Amphritea opalescens]|uniref:DUF3530 family protein n=1 Tax=Amphritea opalescens TaxID=2490544 RepID=A0A430KTY4_9GAMM|nr:DUF3530 family protein [Amphritea opalescens]RTE66783.1 DUF3530 family protein [Amphritea opalescens]